MFNTTEYTLIALWFPRLLGFIYFITFGAFLFQIKGLLGKEGILPVSEYLNSLQRINPWIKRLWYIPTLFWWRSDDRALIVVVWTGVFLSCLLMMGFVPPLLLLLLYILYLSIVSVGQDFLSFGWEGLLLETTAHAFFLSWTVIPNFMVWCSFNFLIFRFYFMAGAVKLQSGDPNWWNLTAVAYHYQTQPLPNTTAWFAHKMPLWFHKISAFLMFGIELVVPFGIFWTQEIRFGAFLLLAFLQWAIWFTGNFSFLNHLTIVLSTLLISNQFLEPFLGPPPILELSSWWTSILLTLCGAFLLFLQVIRLEDQFISHQTRRQILARFSPFHLANRYGIFAVMTTKRYEIVIEGSNDGLDWQEYLFYYKPSEINRRPRRIAPYQPRLDWMAWFLPFGHFEDEYWFQRFLSRLLEGSTPVLSLLRYNPFPGKPPKYIRALIYDYTFSDASTRKKTGNWWNRQLIGAYSPTESISQKVY